MKKILLLNGGVRKTGSSATFLKELEQIMAAQGHEVEILHLIDWWDKKLPIRQLLEAFKRSDLVGMSSSCYVNTLPCSTIACLEALLQEDIRYFKGKSFFVIAHGGMPYLDVHEHMVKVCDIFAEKQQMQFLGGLICGLSAMLNGAKLEEVDFVGTKIKKAFVAMSEEVLEGKTISPRTQKMVFSHVPFLLQYPLAAFLTHQVIKERAAHGINVKEVYFNK